LHKVIALQNILLLNFISGNVYLLAKTKAFCIFAKDNEAERKGTNGSLLLLLTSMSTEANIEIVKKILLSKLYDDIFLVEMKVKPINNFKIYLDADSGLGIEKCIKINRALYKQLEEMGVYPEGDFSLEVSSPGIEEPLKLLRQYVKNIGRAVEVTKQDDTIKEGTLLAATEEAIEIEFTEGKGKKAITTKLSISFTDIKQTVVQIKF
jgi:ribosome maturation factor RimP